MSVVDLDGFQLYHEVLNPGGEQVVVMTHGLFANHTVFYHSGAKALADRGYRVVLWDLPGHGLSTLGDAGLTLDDLTADLIGLMDHLGIGNAGLVGYSVGGAVALKAAMAVPARVDWICSIEGYWSTAPELAPGGIMDKDVDRFLSRYTEVTGVRLPERAHRQLKASAEALVEAGVVDGLEADIGCFDDAPLEDLSMPVLLLYGQSDSADVSGSYAARLRHAKLLTTDGSHFLPVTNADWVKRQLLRFAASRHPKVPARGAAGAGAEPVVSVEDLRMSYGEVEAVKGISFEIEPGCFFAFLGANGAGKSTTINCLTTLLRPTGGKVTIAGHELGKDDQAIRDSIGVVFQASMLDPRLTARENLDLRARMHGLPSKDADDRIEELMDLLEIGSFADSRYKTLSGGQRRRVDIARALIHRPSLLFLDEPTAGLDPHSREQVWQAIEDVRLQEGMTVFLTTHYMAETERTDMVYIIDHGVILAHGTPAALREKYSSPQLTMRLRNERMAKKQIAHFFPHIDLTAERLPGDPLRLSVASVQEVKQILPYVWELLEDFEFRRGSMDDVFLNLTGGHRDPEPEPGVKKRKVKV